MEEIDALLDEFIDSRLSGGVRPAAPKPTSPEAADIDSILDGIVDRQAPSYGRQLAGSAVTAGYRAAAGAAGSSLASGTRAFLVDPLAHLGGPSEDIKFEEFRKQWEGKHKGDALRKNQEAGFYPEYESDPETWPVTPLDAALEEWEKIGGNRKSRLHAASRLAQRNIARKIKGWTPEEAEWAATYAEQTKHNIVSQAVIDFTSNWPNLAAALGGQVVNAAAPGAGSAAAFGFMAAQEESDFLEMAEAAGVPDEFAQNYARTYGAASGGIEYAEQIVNVAGLAGKAGKKAGEKLTKTVAKRALGILKDMGVEGLEEVSQQSLQYAIAAKMLADYGKENDVKVDPVVARKAGLPLDDDGSVAWTDKKTLKSMLRAFQAGAGVAGVSNAMGLAARGGMAAVDGSAKDAVLNELRKRAAGKKMTSPDMLSAWTSENPDAARALAGIEKPTRKDFEKAGLPRVSAKERARIADDLRELVPDLDDKTQPGKGVGEQAPATPEGEEPAIAPPGEVPTAAEPKAEKPVEAPTAEVEGRVVLSDNGLAKLRLAVDRARSGKIDIPKSLQVKLEEKLSAAERGEAVGDGRRVQPGDQVLVVNLDGNVEVGTVVEEDLTRQAKAQGATSTNWIDVKFEGKQGYSVIKKDGAIFAGKSSKSSKAGAAAQEAAVQARAQKAEEVRAIMDRFESGEEDLSPEELKIAAQTDSLTGLRDRRGWNRREKKDVVATFDMDDLKYVNDTHGHEAGDELIKLKAQAMHEVFGYDDSARAGGDEFKAQAATPAEMEQRLSDLTKFAEKNTLTITEDDGTQTEVALKFSYGAAEGALTNEKLAEKQADERARAHKSERTASGERTGRGRTPATVGEGTQDQVDSSDSEQVTPPKAADLAAMKDDDFDALLDEVENELPVEQAEKGRKVYAHAKPGSPVETVDTSVKKVKKIGRKGVKKAPATTQVEDATTPVETKSPGDIIKSAAKHGVKGVEEASKGLYELFGGGKRLGMGVPVDFDAETYAKAKPHFDKAFTEFVAAGRDVKDFVRWAMTEFGSSIRPYLKQFKKDLDSEPVKRDTDSGGKHEDQGSNQKPGSSEVDADNRGGASETGSGAFKLPGRTPGKAEPGSESDGDVRSTEPTSGDRVPGDGVSPPPVGVGGQQASDDGGENVSGSGKHGVVPESSGADTDGAGGAASVDGPDGVRRTNYDLRAKPRISLTKGQRRKLNAEAKAILEKPPESLTEEDLDTLRQYTGEGGLSSGSREALNQHYTDYDTIRAIYRALRDAGVKLKKLLEPAVGSGNFVGHAPEADWTTVDIDETNHRVASALYPAGKHYNISFEEFSASGFDAVISNVPFSEERGKGRNKARPDIKYLHDFYFLHALDRVKPNGVVAFVTSKGTMDRLDSRVRQEIIDKADVIGAFRLPGGHFEANAHTSVTTDIVFMQRRPDGVAARAEAAERNATFLESSKTEDDIPLSRWYQEHPAAILGDVKVGKDKTRGGRSAYEVTGPARLGEIAIDYRPYGQETGKKTGKKKEPVLTAPTNSLEFGAWAEQNNIVYKTSDSNRYNENVEMRDGVVYAVKQEVDFEDIERSAKIYAPVKGETARKIRELDAIRQLATDYQEGNEQAGLDGQAAVTAYRETHEKHPLKDRSLRSFFKKHGEETYLAELASAFTDDMHAADVFFERTRYEGSGRIRVTKDDDLLSQAAAAEDNQGRITFPTEQGFVTEEDAEDLLEAGYALAGYEVYADTDKPYSEVVPNEYYVLGWVGVEANHGAGTVYSAENSKTGESSPELESRDQVVDWLKNNATAADMGKPSVVLQNDILYYSGNIYKKLDQIKRLRESVPAELRATLDKQEAKLHEIMPEPKALEDISVKGSESWLAPFLQRAGIGITSSINEQSGLREYEVSWHELDPDQARALKRHLNNRALATRRSDDGIQESMGSYMRRLRDAENDLRDALEKLKSKLSDDAAIKKEIEYAYNSKYRNYVKPDYERAAYLIQDVLDEIAENKPTVRDPKTGKQVPLELRRNQVAWVIQALYEGRGINAHDVGGGKTMAAIVLARALKRRGRAQKPMFVVPAKTIKKWVKETRLLFPDAKIVDLGALPKNKRERALFDLANSNADYVFISHEGYGKIKLPVETEIGYVWDVVNEHVDDPEASGRQEAVLQERIERYIDSLQTDGRNTRLTWDKLGIDCVIADEAHNFKNIGINSQLVRFGLGTAFSFSKGGNIKSARSYDFRFKANYTTERNNGGNVFLLTATPTPNKPMEIYTMLRHFGPRVFEDYGVENDRDFASTFLQLGTVQDPVKNRPKQILRAIVNAQELRGLLNRFVDKLSMEQMPWITVPGAQENRVFVDQSDQYALVAEDLVQRQRNLPSPAEEGDDTLVAIYTGGRSASVDPRLYGGEHANVAIDVRSFDKNDDKVQWAIEHVAQIAEGNANAGQLVFLDDAGHKRHAEGRMPQNVHGEIKEELVARGLDPTEVAIINGKEITNPDTGREVGAGSNAAAKKAAIQDAYNDGKIKVVIGSTTSMGEGMDLQVKTTDIYHLDIPYTPGAFRQRNGRGVRPGNENDSVNIHYLMMRGSFDSMSLGIVLTKKGWNEAIWDKDVADVISTEEEMTAGVIPNRRQILMELERDPVRRKEMEVQFTLESMESQLDSWRDEHYSMQSRVRSKERRIAALEAELSARRKRLGELAPDERIKNEEKRVEQFEKSKAYAKKLLEVSTRKIQEERESIGKIQGEADELAQQIKALHADIATYVDRWFDQNGEIKVTEADIEPEDGGTMGFVGTSGTGRRSLAGRQEAAKEVEETKKPAKLVQAADIINAIKRQWVGLSVRGKATFRKKALGWFSTKLNEARLKDVRNITVAIHELGHYFDKQMGMWSKSSGLASGIPGELIQLGRDLYGDQRPANGYKAEGFAEFIREFLTGGDIKKRAPKLYEWFTTEYLTAKPKEAKKLRKLEQLVTAYRTQTSGQTVRAFRSPVKQDWSAYRAWSRFVRWIDLKWRDINLAIMHAMKDAGIDPDSLTPENNPYLLATAYSMSASGKARHAALIETTDMAGNRTGEGLRDVLAPISAMGQKSVEEWIDYAVALRAQLLNDRGIPSGISEADANAVVDKYDSAVFRQVAEQVTDWSRRVMHLLVETGVMTQQEFDSIVDLNPVYVPFSRQFGKDEIRPGKGGMRGRGVYRIKGSGREIHNPIDALIMQAAQITQAAMQGDVVRALVALYDKSKGKTDSLGKLMSEVPAPQVATTFSVEKIKKEMGEKAVELGADPDEVAAAMLDTWTDMLTVFTQGTEYRGKDHIVSVVVNGERRFFEVGRDLYKLLSGLNKGEHLSGVAGKISRPVVGLQRMGATGLNPAFGLIRNFLRDAGTTSVTYDYAKGGPFATLVGLAEEITSSDMANRYHAMGVDLSGWIGQHKGRVKKLSRQVTAGTAGRKTFVTATSPIEALRAIFGATEAGPRLAEFKAAYQYAKDQGQSDKSAAITAAVAGKDVSVNFSRAGEYGRVANEIVLFFNAGVQSVDKFGRTFYKHPGRTLLRGAGWITFMSLLAYYRNRDEEWWKELPEYEKWQYVHWELPGGHILRVPLPFEFGIVFGALPVAVIEERRSPGAFLEALSQLQKSTVDGDRLMPAFLSPLWDVARNEDWKGSEIVPSTLKRSRLPKDQYTTQTTDLAKDAGRMLGVSPAVLEHLVNSYSGGLYRRVAKTLQAAGDPSGIAAAGDWSTIPVVGTLFLRHGTSRVTGEFYDRLDELRQLKGSEAATVTDLGELAMSERLNRKLQERWRERREVIGSDKKASAIKTETDAMIKSIHKIIRKHQAATTAEKRREGAGSLLYAATSPGAGPKDKEAARRLLSDMGRSELRDALKHTVKQRGGRIAVRTKTGRLSAYGLRLARLRSLDID